MARVQFFYVGSCHWDASYAVQVDGRVVGWVPRQEDAIDIAQFLEAVLVSAVAPASLETTNPTLSIPIGNSAIRAVLERSRQVVHNCLCVDHHVDLCGALKDALELVRGDS